MKHLGATIALLLLVASAGLAQQASAPTATGETGLFTLPDGWTLPDGAWSFGFYYNNWDRLVAPIPGGPPRGTTDDWDYDWNRLSASVGYGLTDRLELSAALPWEKVTASDNRHTGIFLGRLYQNRIDATGIGDLQVGLKYQLFAHPEEGKALALNAFVELPTGDDKEGVVTGDTGWGLGLNWSLAPHWLARVGYRDPGDSEHFDVSEELQAGIGYVVPLSDRFDWVNELAATLYRGGDSNADNSYDLTTGGRYWFGEDGRWALNFGLRTELNQLGNTDEHCPIGGLVGLTFHPRAKSAAALVAEREAAEKAAEEARVAAATKAAEEAAAAKAAQEAAAAKAAQEAAAAKAAEEAAAARAAEEAARRAAEEARNKESREAVNFDSGSARLSNIAKAKLDEVALRLKQDPTAIATIVGHADAQGTDAGNRRLGERRAEAARDYLVRRHKIDPSRVVLESQGSTAPVASNGSPEGREQNRRAEIVVRIP